MEEMAESMETTTETQDTGNADLGGINPDLLKSLGIETETMPKHVNGAPAEAEDDQGDEEVSEDQVESEDGNDENQPETFEIKHDGVTKHLTREQLLENAQKGFDYTVKTMKLAEERKEFENHKADLERQSQETLEKLTKRQQDLSELENLKNQWDFYLNHLEKNNPDLHDQVMEGFSGLSSQFENPLVKAQLEQMNQMVSGMQKQLQDRENEIIRSQYSKEFDSVKKDISDLLGGAEFSFNEEAIKEAYINGAATVADAVGQVHGLAIAKMMGSKNKVETTKKKVAAKKPTPTSGNSRPAQSTPKSGYQKGMSWNDLEKAAITGALS